MIKLGKQSEEHIKKRVESRKRYYEKLRIKSPCRFCGIEVSKPRSRASLYKGFFCSQNCFKEYQRKNGTKKSYICLICTTKFKRDRFYEKNRGNVKFCSKKCLGQSLKERFSGNKSLFWKGGITSLNHKIRYSSEMKEWRRAVFERDNFTCILCGTKKSPFNADHIKPFSLFPELRFELSNGRTLCVPCHRNTPTWGNHKKREGD